MALLLLFFFNWVVVFYATAIVTTFFGTATNYQLFLNGGVSFLIVTALAFIFYSPFGQWFLRFLSGGRKAVKREHDIIDPVVDRVQRAVKETHGHDPLKIKLMIVDDPVPNAFAIGRDTVIISRGLYEAADEEELAGVFAHEMGHLHNGDSNKLGIALGVSAASLFISWIALLITAVTKGISEAGSSGAGGDAGKIISFFAFVFMLFSWFFLLFVKAGNWMLKLAMLFVGRKQEYRADQFAVKAGFGTGLLSFLDKGKNFEWEGQRSFLSRLYATHPPTMLRIDAVEKSIHQ